MSEQIRLLVVEDNPGDAGLITAYLGDGGSLEYEVVYAVRLSGALERVAQGRFDAILLDLGLPDSAGLETLRAMRGATRKVPIVVLTGRDDESTGLAAILHGAQEYLTKGAITGDLLRHVLRYAIERERSQAELVASRELLRAVIDIIPDSIYAKDLAGRKILANPADVAHILGASDVSDLLGKTDMEVFPPDVAARSEADDRAVYAGVSVLNREEWGTGADGRATWGLTTKIPLRDAAGQITGLVGITRSNTRNKIAEIRASLSRGVLECLNRIDTDRDAISEILQLIKDGTGIEAVGIRLREGDGYPYYQVNGFPEHFVEHERDLCSRDEAGELLRDPAGTPLLACVCGMVIHGDTDATLPDFTAGGSYWTNSMPAALVTTVEEDSPARMRNGCNAEGYQSVALIPLKMGGQIIGLLQLNDRRPGQFTLEAIEYYEGLGASIGVALSRRQATEALRTSEAQYRLLADHMTDTVSLMDLELNPTYLSPSVWKARGVDAGDLREMSLDKRLTPPSLELAQKIASEERARVLTDPDCQVHRTVELEFCRADGTTYWSEITLTMV
ncbi:MAG: response regulator, partial [Anaerolineae bacterium]